MPFGVRTLGSRETAGPAKGCFLRFPHVFQKHKNRHGMPRRAALEAVYREELRKVQLFRRGSQKSRSEAQLSLPYREIPYG
jgi:hypothetical protein